MEWVEVQGKTVEIAVKAALAELGLESPEQVVVEVIQEPKSGFLGIGGQEAIVKVTPKPKRSRSRRRRRGKGGRGEGDKPAAGGSREGQGRQTSKPRSDQPRKKAQQPRKGDRPSSERKKPGREARASKESTMTEDTAREADINEQAEIAAAFLRGLLEAFGLEGTVTTRVEDDILYLDVSGDQTEALVGPKGSIMHAVLELTRTVIQRKTYGAPRMRMDIAGYGERRRKALQIYAGKLAEKVLAEGGEIMLEPMNPADRKVVHDAIVEIEGVRSFSEGEDPNRAVVIALEEGVEPRGATQETEQEAEAEAPEDAGESTESDPAAHSDTETPAEASSDA